MKQGQGIRSKISWEKHAFCAFVSLPLKLGKLNALHKIGEVVLALFNCCVNNC